MTTIEPVQLALLGLGIVFGVLTLMAVIVWGIGKLDARWQRDEAEADALATSRDATVDATTVVLISAAVATLLQGRGRIRRIQRLLPSDAPHGAWSMQGRLSLQGSHSIDRQGSGRKR